MASDYHIKLHKSRATFHKSHIPGVLSEPSQTLPGKGLGEAWWAAQIQAENLSHAAEAPLGDSNLIYKTE